MIFVDPALADLAERRRVKVMKFLPAIPERHDEVGRLEQGEMFGHSLSGHVQVLAQLTQRLPVTFV